MKKIFILGALAITSFSFAKSNQPVKSQKFKDKIEVKSKAKVVASEATEEKGYVLTIKNKCGTMSTVLFFADADVGVGQVLITPYAMAVIQAMQFGYDNCD